MHIAEFKKKKKENKSLSLWLFQVEMRYGRTSFEVKFQTFNAICFSRTNLCGNEQSIGN